MRTQVGIVGTGPAGRAEHFFWWMTTLLRRLPCDDPFDLRLQLSQLRYVTPCEAAARSPAGNYTGLQRV